MDGEGGPYDGTTRGVRTGRTGPNDGIDGGGPDSDVELLGSGRSLILSARTRPQQRRESALTSLVCIVCARLPWSGIYLGCLGPIQNVGAALQFASNLGFWVSCRMVGSAH